MRFNLIAAFGIAAATLAGCVAPVPMTGPAVPTAPGVAPAPTVLDAASRQIARNVVDSEMQRRLPGVNVTPERDICAMSISSAVEALLTTQSV